MASQTTWAIEQGDCIEVMRSLPDNSVHALVTDPPYGLSKPPDMYEVLRHWLNGDDYEHRGSGFMGKSWDSFVPGPSVWKEAYRVMKPGAWGVVFGGTRTYDLICLSLRMAGFEIRDQILWMYGSGMPKSKGLPQAIDKHLGAMGHRGAAFTVAGDVSHLQSMEGKAGAHGSHLGITPEAAEWNGWGTGLKPAFEPIALIQKPREGTYASNVLEHGVGGLNIDGCRVAASDPENHASKGASVAGLESNRTEVVYGEGGKPREDSTHEKGRWPANVILDETAAAMLDQQTGDLKGGTAVRRNNTKGGETSYVRAHKPGTPDLGYGDSGGASRFFYCAKAHKKEREAGLDHLPLKSGGELTDRKDGSKGLKNPRAGAGRGGGRRNMHPTVKPIALMRYLCRLVTPPGGIVLDPYTGSGTTGCAAVLENFWFLGIELDRDKENNPLGYLEVARARINHHDCNRK